MNVNYIHDMKTDDEAQNIVLKKKTSAFFTVLACFVFLNCCSSLLPHDSSVHPISSCKDFGVPCTKSGKIYTCTDSYYACIREAVLSCSPGDTIKVTGEGSVTWPAGAVTIPANKPVNLVGPGMDNLTIILGGNYVIDIDAYVGTKALPATTISGFKFQSPTNLKYAAINVRGQGWRIHHNKYESLDTTNSAGTAEFVFANSSNETVAPYGLIDNNIVINGKILVTGFHIWDKMSDIWYAPLELGNATAVYIENNQFSGTGATYKTLAIDESMGGKYVARYNSFSQCYILVHGLQADYMRGSRSWEIYGNTFSINSYGEYGISLTAGTGVVFNNDFSDSTYPYANYIRLAHERSYNTYTISGTCDGTSYWDGNVAGQNGWPCRDQIGTGNDSFDWSANSTNPSSAQTLIPAYFWSTMDDGHIKAPWVFSTAATHIQANRDYYTHTEAFDGTSGVGCGTLANRPTSCTPGVAYWATEQSCTNMTGMVGVNPATPIEGTLYKCNANGQWEGYYTPYTYPHPLRK